MYKTLYVYRKEKRREEWKIGGVEGGCSQSLNAQHTPDASVYLL